MPRSFQLYIDDMLVAADSVRAYTAELDFETFLADRRTRDAVLYNLTILGEAAARVPADIRALAPDIEWRKMVRLRNIIVHDYFGVNNEIIWDVVQSAVPPLIIACRRLLELPDELGS